MTEKHSEKLHIAGAFLVIGVVAIFGLIDLRDSITEIRMLKNWKLYEVTNPYIVEPFRIWYSTEPRFKLKLQDKNRNMIPDSVEDLARQLKVAQMIFHETLNFPNPLEAEKFKNVKYIDVLIGEEQKMDERVGYPIGAFATGAVSPLPGRPDDEHSLKIFLKATTLYTATPVHEYFHTVQYGMLPTCYSKNKNQHSLCYYSWVTEGTAEWSEDIVRNYKNKYQNVRNKNSTNKWKKQIADALAEKSLSESRYHGNGELYESAIQEIFMPFVLACGEKDILPEDFRRKYQYLNRNPIVEDFEIYGATAINVFFKCLVKNTQPTNTFQNTYYDTTAKACLLKLLDICEPN